MARSRARRTVWIVLALGVLLLFPVLNRRYEPFAKRVEGRTVRGWAEQFAAAENIDPRIVDAFITSAIPKLSELLQAGHRKIRIAGFLREATKNRISTRDAERDEKLMLVAGGWLSWLHAKGYDVELPRNPKLSLWLDAYDDQFYAPRFVQLAITTPEESAEAVKIPVPLKPGERINAGAVIEPSLVTTEQKPWVYVKARIAPGHHVYGLKKALESAIPTKLEMRLPDGISLAGEWSAPRPDKSGSAEIYRKEVVFRNRLVIGGKVSPGKYKARIKIAFQVCNEALCWPPEELEREVEFEVVERSGKR